MAKYHNQKTVADGITFDSKREAQRYLELKAMERAGVISGLARQVRFTLIPAQYQNGRCVERSVSYVADFVYTRDGRKVVEDVKGVRTEAYKLKKKMMRYLLGIEIVEV